MKANYQPVLVEWNDARTGGRWMTMDVITQCHGIVSAMNEAFEGPGPEGPKTSGSRPSAGLLSDICELQDTATRLRDRLDDLVKKL